MKSQIFLATLSIAASLATVESFHLPNNGNPSNLPSSSSSQQNEDEMTNDIASRYSGLARRQMNNQKKGTTSSDIASKYMSLATGGATTKNRQPLVSTWKKEDNDVKKDKKSSSSTPSKKMMELLNFDISSSDQKATESHRRLQKEAAKNYKKNDFEKDPVIMADIDEWSTALKELEDLRRGGQQLYRSLYNFEDSWQ